VSGEREIVEIVKFVEVVQIVRSRLKTAPTEKTLSSNLCLLSSDLRPPTSYYRLAGLISHIYNPQSKICNLLAHFMHNNKFYVVPFRDLELSQSEVGFEGSRLRRIARWHPSPARERQVERGGLIFQN
jgi:hypothetical protein